MTGMQRLLGLLLLAALATPGLASCFGRDASWRVGVTCTTPLHRAALFLSAATDCQFCRGNRR